MTTSRDGRQMLVRLTLCTGLVALAVGCAATKSRGEAAAPAETTQSGRETTEVFIYHVRAGDSLYSLSRRFGVSWHRIAEENGIDDPRDMRVGRPLFIPRVGGAEPSGASPPQEGPAEATRRPVARTDLHRGRPSRRFWWPTAGNLLRSYGAVLRGLPDPGIAIGAPAGTEVYAVDSGTVITRVSPHGSAGSAWGNVLAVAHEGDWVSWYAHLDQMLVGEGDRVRKGEPVGTVGCTGAADRPQLAFRLFHDNRPVDPREHLP